MPHGMHPIPATATSAGEGLLATVPVESLAEFHALPILIPSLLPVHRPLKAEITG